LTKSEKTLFGISLVIGFDNSLLEMNESWHQMLAGFIKQFRQFHPKTPIVITLPEHLPSDAFEEWQAKLLAAFGDTTHVAITPFHPETDCHIKIHAESIECQPGGADPNKLPMTLGLNQLATTESLKVGAKTLFESWQWIEKTNSALSQTSSEKLNGASLYEHLDILAVQVVNKTRTKHRGMFIGAAILCGLIAIVSGLFQFSPLLMILPVIVFWLLKLSVRYRQGQEWKVALFTRSFAEMLRIRQALSEKDISQQQILECIPRQCRGTMLPSRMVLIGTALIDAKLVPNKRSTYTSWVDEQINYYRDAVLRQRSLAKSGLQTFDLAFTSLTLIAMVVIACAIAQPLIPALARQNLFLPYAAALGSFLSSCGLIAINFSRETGAGLTAKDYQHMLYIFESAKNAQLTSPTDKVLETAHEAIAEHAAWFSRLYV
jgi:hypothetical protein